MGVPAQGSAPLPKGGKHTGTIISITGAALILIIGAVALYLVHDSEVATSGVRTSAPVSPPPGSGVVIYTRELPLPVLAMRRECRRPLLSVGHTLTPAEVTACREYLREAEKYPAAAARDAVHQVIKQELAARGIR